MPQEKDSGHCWLFDRGRGQGHSLGAKVRTRPTVGLTTHFGVPLNSDHFPHSAALGQQLCTFYLLGLGLAVGTDGSQQLAWPGLFITCHKTCCVGVFSTLDSVSPTGDWFKMGGLHGGCSQQHLAKDMMVSGWQIRNKPVCVRAQLLRPDSWLRTDGEERGREGR